jgi:hypothetical protein
MTRSWRAPSQSDKAAGHHDEHHDRALNNLAEAGANPEKYAIEDVIAAVNLTGYPAPLPRFVVTRFAQAGRVGQSGLSDPRAPLCLFLMMARNRPLKRAASIACDVLVETIEDLVRTSAWPGRYVGHID